MVNLTARHLSQQHEPQTRLHMHHTAASLNRLIHGTLRHPKFVPDYTTSQLDREAIISIVLSIWHGIGHLPGSRLELIAIMKFQKPTDWTQPTNKQLLVHYHIYWLSAGSGLAMMVSSNSIWYMASIPLEAACLGTVAPLSSSKLFLLLSGLPSCTASPMDKYPDHAHDCVIYASQAFSGRGFCCGLTWACWGWATPLMQPAVSFQSESRPEKRTIG